jgi:hypothetical protein
MIDEYYEIAFINQNEAILHGKRADGSDVRTNLTITQQEAVSALDAKHQREMQALLRGYAEESRLASLAHVANGPERIA